ncbi:MAG: hypothetical protein EOO90_14295 [Pedobacter sp.]|nr:MAG: hypothetical protein EOO90_14295 [Pedobacter sp.]
MMKEGTFNETLAKKKTTLCCLFSNKKNIQP